MEFLLGGQLVWISDFSHSSHTNGVLYIHTLLHGSLSGIFWWSPLTDECIKGKTQGQDVLRCKWMLTVWQVCLYQTRSPLHIGNMQCVKLEYNIIFGVDIRVWNLSRRFESRCLILYVSAKCVKACHIKPTRCITNELKKYMLTSALLASCAAKRQLPYFTCIYRMHYLSWLIQLARLVSGSIII